MFGISLFELAVIVIVALLAFGPEQLPQIARKIGKIVGQGRALSDAFRRELYNSVYTPSIEEKEKIVRSLRGEKVERTDTKSPESPQSGGPSDTGASNG